MLTSFFDNKSIHHEFYALIDHIIIELEDSQTYMINLNLY